jgi:hypothetical protein
MNTRATDPTATRCPENGPDQRSHRSAEDGPAPPDRVFTPMDCPRLVTILQSIPEKVGHS